MNTFEIEPNLLAWFEGLGTSARGFTSDSRDAQTGIIFVASKGEKVDGHDFVENALKSGAIAAIVRKGFAAKLPQKAKEKIFEVEDTHLAHRSIAHLFRLRFKGKIIGVGGSSGKTSAKEFLHQIISTSFKCFKTQKSQNGELGIPKTLEQLSGDYEMGIVEIGIDAPGDMIRHATLVKPDLAVLTSIGEEHLNLLKSVENVFLEEKILFDLVLSNQGHCFAPMGDEYLKKLAGTDPNIHMVTTGDLDLKIPFSHPYARQNAALAAHVALFLGMGKEAVQRALNQLELPEGRGREIRLANGSILIADHYNANPSSMRAGLLHARELSQRENKKLHLILGDMLDLGQETEKLHRELLPEIESTGATEVVLIGPQLKGIARQFKTSPQVYANSQEAADRLKAVGLSHPCVVLLKGSRGMALEKVLAVLAPNN